MQGKIENEEEFISWYDLLRNQVVRRYTAR